MSEHPNLQLMRRTLAAFQSGDIPTLQQVFAPDIVWRVPGKSTIAKEYRGQGEVFGFFGRLMELTAGTFKVESLDLMANERGGTYLDRVTATRNGKSLDVQLVLHVRIADGRIVEGTDYFHDEHRVDAFFA